MHNDQVNVPATPLAPCLFTRNRPCTCSLIASHDIHESTRCLGRYHGMMHDTPCTGCHQEVHVPFSLPCALADIHTPSGYSSSTSKLLVLSLETIEKLDKRLHPVSLTQLTLSEG